MTDQDVILKLQDLFGGNVAEFQPKYPGSKEFWIWTIHGSQAVDVMEKVRPYMFSRRSSKIDEILSRWNARKEELASEENFKKYLADQYVSGNGTYRALAEANGVSRSVVFNAVKKYHKNLS